MIENTELGVLISHEEWAELQEKLEKQGTHSNELQSLKEENKRLKNALRQVELFLNKGEANVPI